MHVKFFVLLKINEEKLWKHIPFQRILWSVLDQIYQWFLNLCHLKIQLIRPTFCSFTHSLQIWSLQKAKTHPVNIHQSMRGNVWFFFFWCNPSTDFLHQVCQPQMPYVRLQLIRPRIAPVAKRWTPTSLSSVSQPKMHFLPTWSPLPKLQYINNLSVNIFNGSFQALLYFGMV